MIYAVITDELGLFGAAAVLLTYLMFVARGFKTALLARDSFSKLLAAGLTAMFALQVFVIVGGVTRVIPLTGVTLPFISYGGSSIVANFVLLALLLLVSDRARRPRVNSPIVRLFGVIVVLFALLIVLHVALDGVRRIVAEQQPAQRPHAGRRAADQAGRILADDGTVLAKSVPAAGHTWSRTYPTGPLFAQRSATRSPPRERPRARGLGRPALRGVQTGLTSVFGQLQPATGRRRRLHDARPQGPARGRSRRSPAAPGSVVALDPRPARSW